jgi:myo-inositol catabolism protein IolH
MGGDITGVMEYAGDLLTHLHVADSFDHRASSGLRYIVNPPGFDRPDPPASRHRAGRGRLDEFFATLGRMKFDGIMTVCVFAWEERAHESSRYMRETIEKRVQSWS